MLNQLQTCPEQLVAYPTLGKNATTIQVDYLKGIVENNDAVVRMIYTKYLPTITNFVLKNNGSEIEARDVFQDGLIVIYKKTKAGDLNLTCSFHTFLFATCRFIWLRELKKKYRQEVSLENTSDIMVQHNMDKVFEDNDKQKLFKSKMKELCADSQKVLNMFFEKVPMKEIANIMGYTEEYAKRKKYKAKNQLIKLIKLDPMYSYLYQN